MDKKTFLKAEIALLSLLEILDIPKEKLLGIKREGYLNLESKRVTFNAEFVIQNKKKRWMDARFEGLESKRNQRKLDKVYALLDSIFTFSGGNNKTLGKLRIKKKEIFGNSIFVIAT